MDKYLRESKAVFIKDFIIARSYKLNFFLGIFSSMLTIMVFYFVSQIFSLQDSDSLSKYGSSYFNFVFFGIIFSDLAYLLISSLSQEISKYKLYGVFEEIIANSKNPIFIILCSFLFPLFNFFIKLFFYLLIGFIIFDINIIAIDTILFLIFSIIFSLVCFMGIALLSAAYTIIFLKGNPILTIYFSASSILGGVLFPINVLPEYLIFISKILPISHILEITRMSHISGINELYGELFMLMILALIYFLTGIYACKKAIEKSKLSGSLIYY